MPGHIPCSVQMLTRNSASTLEAALQSVSDFAEIVIGDGGSTDGTRAIAARYGCRVFDQDSRYADDAGRLLDYAGARSQLIPLSSYDWILCLDSDEVLTPEAAATIADAVSGTVRPEVGGYLLPAKHVVYGVLIEDESKPSYHEARLFRRSAVDNFVGFVNEVFELAPGYVVDSLDAVFLKPLPPARQMIPKCIRYLQVLAVGATRNGPDWTDQQLPGYRSSIRWLVQGWLAARRRGHPQRLPFRYEAIRILNAIAEYATLRLVRLSQRLRGKRPADVGR